MIENSGSPLPDATAPITADELATSPAYRRLHLRHPALLAGVSRASSLPRGDLVSPASASISVTFSPGRSGWRTAVCPRVGRTMLDTSTPMSEKQ